MTISEPKKVKRDRPKKWQVNVFIDGKRTRRYFLTFLEASKFREDTLKAGEVVGQNVIVTKQNQQDVATAMSLLPEGVTLTQVVTDWVSGKGRTDKSGVSYVEAMGRYWKHLTDRNLAKGTYRGYRHCHYNVLDHFGDRDTAEDISKDLEKFFLDLINVHNYAWLTAKRHKAYMDGFYRWAIKERLTTDNWVKYVHFARETRLEKVFLTANETTTLLRTAEEFDPSLCNMLVLGLFAGLRAEEIRDGDSGKANFNWDHIDFHEQTIFVEKAKTSGGNVHTQRFVENLQGNIWAWLETYGHYGLNLSNWRKRLKLITDIACIDKRMNSIFRKSFATHAVPIQGAGITAVQMGHTGPATTQKHYKGLVTKKQAEAYFDILPKEYVRMKK